MIGVGCVRSGNEVDESVEMFDEVEHVLAADQGVHIAGMPPLTAVALLIAIVSALIAYQQAPADQEFHTAETTVKVVSPLVVEDAASVVWREMPTDRG